MKRPTGKDFDDILKRLETLTGLKLYIDMSYLLRPKRGGWKKVPCYSLMALDEGGTTPLVDGAMNIGYISIEDGRCFYNCLEMLWSTLSYLQGKTVKEVTI